VNWSWINQPGSGQYITLLGLKGTIVSALLPRRKNLVGAENAAQPIDGHATHGDCHHDDKRYPSPLEKGRKLSCTLMRPLNVLTRGDIDVEALLRKIGGACARRCLDE